MGCPRPGRWNTKLPRFHLQEWQDYQNYARPHGPLGGQTPDERLRQKTTPRQAMYVT